MEFDDEIREFLIESSENLANLDRELVELEKNPRDMQLISSAFRTIHTIKGTCGFFGYDILGSVTHVAENILSQVREGQRLLTPGLISLLLESMDAVKALLANIEANGAEGEDTTGPLRARLEAAERAVDTPAASKTPESKPEERPIPCEPPQAAASSAQAAKTIEALAHFPAPGPADAATGMRAATIPAPLPQSIASAPPPESSREGQLTDSTIRVDVGLLNKLINLVGELVLARNQLLQDPSELSPALLQASQRLNLITSELQEGVMKTRMQPIGVIWNKLPRVVRDLASQCGKQIRMEMEGAETELDKTIIEAIKDPLTHIVRNACDHGVEMPGLRLASGKPAEGRLLLRAYHEGGVVNIEISDDGAGIDPARVRAKAVEKGLLRAEQAAALTEREAIHMIFAPGFSTAAAITSISGRGVGMDVVKTNIEKIGGSVEVQNGGGAAGTGTTIRIKIPLTLAIIPGLVVTLDRDAPRQAPEDEAEAANTSRSRATDASAPLGPHSDAFIIPQGNLLELLRVESEQQDRRIERIHGVPILHHRGRLLPLLSLRDLLGRRPGVSEGGAVHILIVQAEERQLALAVDGICDTQEIVVKPLGRQLKGLDCYVGATIMGDGRPALILDVAGLARLAGLDARISPAGHMEAPAAAATPSAELPGTEPEMLLLFTAGGLERIAVPLAAVDRLEEVMPARLERVGGRPALAYRGEILPLIAMEEVLGSANAEDALARAISAPAGGSLQVVVFARGSGRIGLVVDRILDIVSEAVSVRCPSAAPGLLGSALIAGRITDLLDLHAVAPPSRQAILQEALL